MPNCWFSIHRVQYVSAKSNVQYSLVPLSSSSVRTNNILSQNSNSISAWYWHLEANMCNVTFSLALLNVSSVSIICVHIAHWHLLLVLAFRALWQVNRSGHGCEQDAAGRLRTEVLWLQITIWSPALTQGVKVLFSNGEDMVGSSHKKEITGGVCA